MAVLIDPPMWPAHGTLWSHLVSDADYAEVHAFAKRLPVPRRSFDLDHYDVPASLHARAIALGAEPVGAKELARRLRRSGLRVRQIDRGLMTPVRRREYLQGEWEALGRALGIAGAETTAGAGAGAGAGADAGAQWRALGDELLARWNEPHRRYHDERHLEDVLLSLDQLAVRGETLQPSTLLAAWFHDAVYTGRAGPGAGAETDEAASAALATEALARAGLDAGLVAEVGAMIADTEPARAVERPSTALAQLLDADLAIFAAPPHRYDEYAAAVREEYAHVPDAVFAQARADILSGYLGRPRVYRTGTAREAWEARARQNLAREIAALRLRF